MEEFGLTIKGLLKELLRHNGVVVHTIDHRVKTEKSAKRKLSRQDASYEGFSSLHDLLGLRITCYFSDDIDRIVKIIEDEFLMDHSRSVDKGKQLGTREFGYRSVHRVAQISASRSKLAEYDRYKSLRFEIQIRTVVQQRLPSPPAVRGRTPVRSVCTSLLPPKKSSHPGKARNAIIIKVGPGISGNLSPPC
jgi:putative GTP pyrophosphokinase